ncbi:hypothetical protein [Streptomyces albus]|uniref:copper amine oxidase n=1 Tax=Streptomyces albus TaxID=1888 RepID=UPI0024E0A8A0|nr:hypothetical protein [Streptomyces albus]GHJ23722.1 hypothetical protein TPA0909_53360 [Streptomyces albus]
MLYTVNSAGYYHYINQWNFSDDGTITPKAGATGNLSPSDYDASDDQGWPVGNGSKSRATSHHHNIFWRLDFAADGAGDATVEQFDTHRSGSGGPDRTPAYRTTRRQLTKEAAGNAGPAGYRWWRGGEREGQERGRPPSFVGAGAPQPGQVHGALLHQVRRVLHPLQAVRAVRE